MSIFILFLELPIEGPPILSSQPILLTSHNLDSLHFIYFFLLTNEADILLQFISKAILLLRRELLRSISTPLLRWTPLSPKTHFLSPTRLPSSHQESLGHQDPYVRLL